MTKADIVKALELEGKTFDYALPQNWVDKVREQLPLEMKDDVVPNFIWLYDDKSGLMGRPCSLSFRGNEILSYVLRRPELHLDGRYFEAPPDLTTDEFLRLLMKVIDKSNNDPLWVMRILQLAVHWRNDCLDILLDFFHLGLPPHPSCDSEEKMDWWMTVIPKLRNELKEVK